MFCFPDVVYNGFVILDHTFEKALNNPRSQNFKVLATKMQDSLENVFCDAIFQNCSLEITGFRKGSVITDFSVIINTITGQESVVEQFLNFKMARVPSTIEGISVTQGSFSLGK